MKHWLAVSVLLLLLTVVPAAAAPPSQALAPSELPLAAVFAAWYGYDHTTGECRPGLGSTHWNDSVNTGGVVYRPEPGYYCSADPAVVTWQLDLLEQMGVRVLFISWWGWGDGNLDDHDDVPIPHDKYMNNGIKAVLEDIKANEREMRVAFIAEPFPQTQTNGEIVLTDCTPNNQDACFLERDKKIMVLDRLWQDYYGNLTDEYSNLMFQWEGKPLLLVFDPMTLPADDRYTIKHWTGRPRDPDTEDEGWQWFFGPPQDVIEGMSDDGVAWVYPRFDEGPAKDNGATYITWDPRRIDPYLREGRYEQQWQSLAQHRDDLRMIVLYSWNLYGEQAHVEPSSGCPAAVWNRYVEKTAAYYNALLAGEPIVPLDGPTPGCVYLPFVWQ